MSHKPTSPAPRTPRHADTQPSGDVEALFEPGSPEDWWAALGRQPLDALVRPALDGDEQVPVVAATPAAEDLDMLAALLDAPVPED